MQIVDMDQYKQYMAIAPESIRKAGGEYLVRGGALEVLEDDWTPKRMAATSLFNMVLLDGVAAQV